MASRVNCPHCGAINVATAEWCGQCYELLAERDHDERSAGSPAGVGSMTASSPPPPSSIWECPVCGEDNNYGTDTCAVCGTSMFERFMPAEEKVDPNAALRASLVPGLGLVRVGLGGEAVIVMLLVGFSLLGGVAIMIAGEPLGILLVVVGASLWAVASRDAYVVATAGREDAWLKPRSLTIAAIVVMLVTAAALLRALPGGRGS